LAVSLKPFPSGTLKTPYYYQYNLGIEQQIGTRGLHEPCQVQLNGYQTVCDGCFAPFGYQRPLDQRFGNVNEFRTNANSSYAGLQTAYTQQWGGLTLRQLYVQSLPRRSIEWRLAGVLNARSHVAFAWRVEPAVCE
jgi:hypothetical protein